MGNSSVETRRDLVSGDLARARSRRRKPQRNVIGVNLQQLPSWVRLFYLLNTGKPTFPSSGANHRSHAQKGGLLNGAWLQRAGSERGFKSLTFSPFLITRHSLGIGFAADGEGREGRVWLTINLRKLEMSRPTQPRQGAAGALISPLSRPLTPPSLYFHQRALRHLSRC